MKNVILSCLVILGMTACDQGDINPTATTGVTKATADVQTRPDGMTVEQANVKRRIESDNKPGSVKFVYCISTFSGEVIFQSTAKGKVTSSGKRLSPYSVASTDGQYVGSEHYGEAVRIGGNTRRTTEVLQDDGTYGSSIPYVFWWDVNDVYHQHYITGGQIFIVRDQPMTVNRVSIDLNINAQTDGN